MPLFNNVAPSSSFVIALKSSFNDFLVLSNAALLTLFATVVATFSETLPATDLAT